MGKLSDLALLAPTPKKQVQPKTRILHNPPPLSNIVDVVSVAEEKELVREAITEALETRNYETVDVGLMSLDTLKPPAQEEVIQENPTVSEEETSTPKQEDPMLQGLLDNIIEKYNNAGSFKDKLALLNQINNILE